jgi:hypothetical protein
VYSSDVTSEAAEAERVVAQWREGGHPVDVFISVAGLGASHRILGWVIEVDGAAGVHAKDSCFVLFPRDMFTAARRVRTSITKKGTRIEIECEGCVIRFADYDENDLIGNA